MARRPYQADFSPSREAETLAECETILRALHDLESAIASGPRLTLSQENFRRDAFTRIRNSYQAIANNCRRNLRV